METRKKKQDGSVVNEKDGGLVNEKEVGSPSTQVHLQPGALKAIVAEKRRQLAAKFGKLAEKKKSKLRFASSTKVVMDSPPASKRSYEAAFGINPTNEDDNEDENMSPQRATALGRTQATSPLHNLNKTRRSLRHFVDNDFEDDFNTPQKNSETMMNESPKSRLIRPSTKGSPAANTRSSHRQSIAHEEDVPLNNNQEEFLVNSTEHVTQNKRKRGPTKLKGIALQPDGRITVRFNARGQVVGEGSVSLSSFIGPLVRELVPYTIADWRKVPKSMKDILWSTIQVLNLYLFMC